MSFYLARLVGVSLFLVVFSTGCARCISCGVPASSPHVYSGGEEAYLSPEEELEAVKREIRRHCHFKHDLDPTFDTPESYSSDPVKRDEAREKCYQLKVQGSELHEGILRLQELSEQAEAEDQPSPGTIRFGDGPLEQVKK